MSGATSAAGGLDPWLDDNFDTLVAFRRRMHSRPELSGQEHETTERIANRLQAVGLQTRRFAVGTGLECTLTPPGAEGPVLALRADIDALAMVDEKSVSYRSQRPGVAHACGHDVHTAIVLGVGLYYAEHPDRLPGPLRLVFQPAEERVPGGALDVIADGGLTNVGAVVGVHCDPKLDAGLVGLKAGAISSAADMLSVSLSGPGGHTARPELTVDLVQAMARIVRELPGQVAQACGGDGAVKIVFGSVHAGDAPNVIPTHCEIRASVRTQSLDVWEQLPSTVERCLTDVIGDIEPDGRLAFDLNYVHGVPPVVNDEALMDLVGPAITDAVGADAITPAVQSWGGDDFAWLAREVPGCFVRLGVHDPASGGPHLDLHAGHFDVDERAIAIGVRVLIAAATAFHH